MKKSKGMFYSVLGIAFILFNVIAFVIPTEKTATFWIAYVFSVIAFIAQAVIWNIVFKAEDTLKSKFLGLPTISIGFAYGIIQLIAFAVFMAFPLITPWIAIVVCSVIFGFSAIFLISTEVGKDEVKRVEKKVAAKVSYIKDLQVDVELLADSEPDIDIKNALKKLAEKIRYSDPMSEDSLVELDRRISDSVDGLKCSENKSELIRQIDSLITERNNKTKILK